MTLSPGSWIIIGLALISSVLIAVLPTKKTEGLEFWVFARGHAMVYESRIQAWNEAHPGTDQDVTNKVISIPAMERRLLSGFLSGTPVPDLVEIETSSSAKFFSGPLDAIGFMDITDRLREEGLENTFNPPSLRLWQTRGRTFGLPHDVHPVLLAYRADIVEAAGIDVNEIETWDDFTRVMRPLMTDENGDGRPDRYILNVWETNAGVLDVLSLQAGGQHFSEAGRPTMASEVNARVMATIVSWTTGPERIGLNAPAFSAEGNYLFLSGQVLCEIMPDWLAGVWKLDLPGLSGKMKLMPLPAWEPGGRRTSVMGGTMLAVVKDGKDPEAAWEFAKKLYLDREVARAFYRQTGIIPPSTSLWDDPVFDEPNPYFSGQANGRMYIEAAPNVPARISSPFRPMAGQRMGDALLRLKRYAEQNRIYDVEKLIPRALAELKIADAELEQKIKLNRFLDEHESVEPATKPAPAPISTPPTADARP